MKLLVCGGAGYVGSHAVRKLVQTGHNVTVLDNLSTGHRAAVRTVDFVEADVRDSVALDAVFASHRFDAVMHFCALSVVGESVRDPAAYYDNNVQGSLNLFRAMLRAGVDKLVFSSTAAVYGDPQDDRIAEAHPCRPINPYGASKHMVERMLSDLAAAHGLRSVSLRYFNAAGASPGGDIGESHAPETHLIPNVLRAALGTGPRLKVFGRDYPTPDGTCVRDFVHVDDLADAHERALDHLNRREGAAVFNLGNGAGFSVIEVIEACRRVTDLLIEFDQEARRAGDPAVLVACSALARAELGWTPRYTQLDEIVETAWRWHKAAAY